MDYQKLLSKRITGLKPSGIRRFFDLAGEMEGVISLGVGEPDFKTPRIIRRAGIRSLEDSKTWYTANAGLQELKDEIGEYLSRRFCLEYDRKDEIVVTVGGSEAIDIAIRAFVEEGDEVLIPEPSFVCYHPITVLSGGVPVPIETKEEDEFRLTPQELQDKITKRTKLLVLPFPNNPTGAVMRREEIWKQSPKCSGIPISWCFRMKFMGSLPMVGNAMFPLRKLMECRSAPFWSEDFPRRLP